MFLAHFVECAVDDKLNAVIVLLNHWRWISGQLGGEFPSFVNLCDCFAESHLDFVPGVTMGAMI
jgi:hypothetical protein